MDAALTSWKPRLPALLALAGLAATPVPAPAAVLVVPAGITPVNVFTPSVPVPPAQGGGSPQTASSGGEIEVPPDTGGGTPLPAAPEPASLLLAGAGSGLAALATRSWRRRVRERRDAAGG
jgi:hypothetical protein